MNAGVSERLIGTVLYRHSLVFIPFAVFILFYLLNLQ